MKKFRLIWLTIFCGTILLLAGCGGSGSGSGEGTLSTSLADSSTFDYQAVYVTIERVDVHRASDNEGEWQTVSEPGQTYNLLELVNGARETLGLTTLVSGHYSQLRLIIGDTAGPGPNILSTAHPYANYLIDRDDNIHELKVPSGYQTGVKIVNGFDINDDRTTELILDFDALRSVVKAGSSGQYLLKPTIKVLDTDEYVLVSGSVFDATTESSLPGALVTAQSIAVGATDPLERITIQAGTPSDAIGYTLFLQPGSYHLVAVQDGYQPFCAAVDLVAGSIEFFDFSLAALDTEAGTLAGSVTIAEAPADQYVSIELRRTLDCSGSTETVIVRSLNVAAGGSYEIVVPPGEYQLVSSTFGKETQVLEVTLNPGATMSGDLAF